MTHLIKRYQTYDPTMLNDALVLFAAHIESAYQMAGVAYTQQDCMDKAFELVKMCWRRNSSLSTQLHASFEGEK